MHVNDVIKEAFTLNTSEKLILVEELLRSLYNQDKDTNKECEEEAYKRVEEHRNTDLDPISMGQVFI